jgi:hypothetical protein
VAAALELLEAAVVVVVVGLVLLELVVLELLLLPHPANNTPPKSAIASNMNDLLII